MAALREHPLAPLALDHGRVRTLYSGISRGTERLVIDGRVPRAEWSTMRAPLQVGDFPFPVKYGYGAVGVVESGRHDLLGRTVFCLHPHQDRFDAPQSMLIPVPDDVPPQRATLAANMETALNAVWDSGAGPADRIAVIGAGVVGLLVGALAARLPGAAVTICDIDPARAELVRHLGVRFARPSHAPRDCDVVFHASAADSGLSAALACAGTEATVVEMSWYGDRTINAGLGGAFHSRRLRLIGSQVGMVASSRRARWPHARRLDALVGQAIDLADAPRLLPALLADGALGLAPVIRYPGAA